jgi:hypothetical protein
MYQKAQSTANQQRRKEALVWPHHACPHIDSAVTKHSADVLCTETNERDFFATAVLAHSSKHMSSLLAESELRTTRIRNIQVQGTAKAEVTLA